MFDISMLPDNPDSKLIRSGNYAAAFKSQDVLVSGIAHLLAFIQANWLGPPLELAPSPDFSLQDLASGGELPYKLARHLPLLASAKELLKPTGDFIADWWYLRCMFVHQKLFENPLSAIKEPIFEVIAKYNDRLRWTHSLETSLVCAYYEQENEALGFLGRASRSLAFEYELGGALGKRLRHQTFDVSQLVVNTNKDTISKEAQDGCTAIELEDEDVLRITRISDIHFEACSCSRFARTRRHSCKIQRQRRSAAFAAACLCQQVSRLQGMVAPLRRASHAIYRRVHQASLR